MSNTGEFFQVDRRTWAKVCALGMNPAVAYLVLARFSGRDNRTTAASTHAIETYTGIARPRARAAIEALTKSGLVKQTQGGARPRYDLVPLSAPANTNAARPRLPLTPFERTVYERIAAGEQPSGRDLTAAHRVVQKGWLRHDHVPYRFAVVGEPVPPSPPAPEWIWLPNTLVDGAAKEQPPVERVRQTQDPMCLRLLVDLYGGQDLAADGGIGRKHVRQRHVRQRLCAHGPFSVWAFWSDNTTASNWTDLTQCHQRAPTADEKRDRPKEGDAVDIFRRLKHLEALGLIEWVLYLFESDSPDAEVIHPLGTLGRESGRVEEQLADRLTAAANRAACSMLNAEGRDFVQKYPPERCSMQLVPVLHHIANVAVVGVARLRYRPHTKNTAAWWAELHEKGARWVARYEAMASGQTSVVSAVG